MLEDVDWNDPLSVLLTREGEIGEVEVMQTMWMAGTASAKTYESPRSQNEVEPAIQNSWIDH